MTSYESAFSVWMEEALKNNWKTSAGWRRNWFSEEKFTGSYLICGDPWSAWDNYNSLTQISPIVFF